MFKHKNKFKVVIFSFVSICTVFLLGICVGIKYFSTQSKQMKFEAKTIRFYTIKKMLGKTMTNDEKNVVKKFNEKSNECLKKLTDNEKDYVDAMVDEILSLVANNNKVIFRLKDLKSVKQKELTAVAKKVKKCNTQSKKHLTKEEKKTLKIATSKMEVRDIIKLYNGIR